MDPYERNIHDLESQLNAARIRIKELVEENRSLCDSMDSISTTCSDKHIDIKKLRNIISLYAQDKARK